MTDQPQNLEAAVNQDAIVQDDLDREQSLDETTTADLSPTPERPDLHFTPNGAFIFVLLMLAAYVVYFFITWYEIVILRGA